MKEKKESLLQALIKRDMLLVASCCTRIFVSVISSSVIHDLVLFQKVIKVFLYRSFETCAFIYSLKQWLL